MPFITYLKTESWRKLTMNKSKSLIFFGTEAFSLSALKALVENDFNVVAVVTKPDSARGRSKELRQSLVKQYAQEANLPVIQHANVEEIEEDLKQFDAFAAVLSSFGKIIPPTTLGMFKGGIINVHPSLLPKYRGASPIEQSILNGDEITGVSLMKLVEKMDAGPVYSQQSIELSGEETSAVLYETLAQIGSSLLVDNLPQILSGELEPKAQDENLVSFAPMISKQDGVIDWSLPATTIEQQIRAYKDWPGSKTTLGGIEVTIAKATAVNKSGESGNAMKSGDDILVYCGEDALMVHQLKPAGKREMSSKEFLLGNKVI